MKKVVLFAAAALLVGGLMVGNNVVAQDNGPAEMTLQTAEGKKPAVFPHAKHQELMGADKCDVCHKDANFPAEKGKWTKDSGHALCKDCHTKGYMDKKGPTKCNDCHKKAGGGKKLEGC